MVFTGCQKEAPRDTFAAVLPIAYGDAAKAWYDQSIPLIYISRVKADSERV